MTVSERTRPGGAHTAFGSLLERRLGSDLIGDGERRRIVASLFHEGAKQHAFLHRFLALMTLSVLIAVLGLLADSTAVVIGAMLVAPLMGPVLAIAAAIVMDWPRRVIWAATMTVIGVLAAVALAAFVSFLVPGRPDPIPSELLARTAPTLLDLGVALVAGAAGAYARVRRQAADAITGVAVAVALVPPLATIGVTLEMQEWNLAIGATLLFLANVSGIITAAAITFVLCGLVPFGRLTDGRVPIGRGIRLALAMTMLIMAPLQMIDSWLEPKPVGEDQRVAAIETFMGEWRPDVNLVSIDVDELNRDSASVAITVAESEFPVEAEQLAEHLAEELGSDIVVEVLMIETTSDLARADENGGD